MTTQTTARPLESMASAALRTGLSVDTIRRRIADGTLTAYRTGPRLIRLDPAQVDAALLRPIPAVHSA